MLTTDPSRYHAAADLRRAVRSTVADRLKEDDRLKVGRPKAAVQWAADCHLGANLSWADDSAVAAVAAAVAGSAAAVVDETTAIPSCSMSIDSSTTAAHGSAHPSTGPPKR